MNRLLKTVAVTAFAVLGISRPGSGQALSSRLSGLLTDTGTLPTGFVQDRAAAEATRDAVAGLFVVEFGTLPLVSSSAGFVYRLNPTLGIVERASDSFGPFYTERAFRSGRKHVAFGMSHQTASFGSLQGFALSAGTFPTNAVRGAGATQPFGVDTLALSLEAQTTTPFVTLGAADRLDVEVAVPLVRIRLAGRRSTTVAGQTALQAVGSGTASGVGDIAVGARYLLARGAHRSFAVGGDVRVPTGREEDLLGAGNAAARLMAIGSWEPRRFGAHGNVGFGVGGISPEVFWAGAATVAVAPRVTVVGELTGRRLSELTVLDDVYAPHSSVSGLETMRWVPVGKGVHTAFFATGVKVNVANTVLLNASLLVRLTDSGLRARITPNVSLSYALQR